MEVAHEKTTITVLAVRDLTFGMTVKLSSCKLTAPITANFDRTVNQGTTPTSSRMAGQSEYSMLNP